MPQQGNKTQLLDSAGYAYNFDRMMYINRGTRKAFSVEFIDDNREDEIAAKIQEPKETPEWQFYTNSDLSEGTKQELNRVLQ